MPRSKMLERAYQEIANESALESLDVVSISPEESRKLSTPSPEFYLRRRTKENQRAEEWVRIKDVVFGNLTRTQRR